MLTLLKQGKKEIVRRPGDKSSGDTTRLTTKQDSKPPPDKEALEKRATSLYNLAKSLADAGKTDKARPRLEDIIKKYPDTLAADDAKELLDKITK
ncbi:MAG TPA: tetratricopeptide repeat protein [Gemmataceae bacterium]|nr:tetratricopeptide repeat protein [Gemmataceae bacterium]